MGSPEMVQETHSKGQSLQLLRGRGNGPRLSQDQGGDHCPSFTGGLRLATVNLLGWAGEAEQYNTPTLVPCQDASLLEEMSLTNN